MPEHKCTVCGKGFQSPSHLKRHMTSHTGEKLFECEICGKKLGYRKSYTRHMRTHTCPPKQCHMCKRSYRSQEAFEKHLKDHEVPRIHKCDICGSLYDSPSSLRSHYRVHTGEKPFCCEVCDQRFTQSSSLYFHMRTIHKESQHPDQICGSQPSTTVSLQVDPLVGEVVSTTKIVESFDQTTAISYVKSPMGSANVVVISINSASSATTTTMTTVTSETGESVSSVDCAFSGPYSGLDPQDHPGIPVKDVFMGNERIDVTCTPAPLTAMASGTGSISSNDYGPPHLDDSDDDSDDLCNMPTENTSYPLD